MASYNKAPPAFNKDDDYIKWCKKIKIWESLTSLEKSKQGPALFLALDDDSQEAILQLDHDEIACDDGVENIINKLDKLYLKDKTQSAFEAFENFEGYRRPYELPISEYCNEFDKRYNKVKSYGTVLPEDLLGFRLLKSANLPPHQEQLAKATITDITYDNMKTQLKKILGSSDDTSTSVINPTNDVLYSDSQETYYGRSYNQDSNFSGRGRSRSNNRFNARRGYQRTFRGGAPQPYQQKKGTNPLDQFGNVTTCIECKSINHWVDKCPDRKQTKKEDVYFTETHDDERYEGDSNSETFYQITLLQADFDESKHMKNLVGESFNSGILDCGAAKTVCGKLWFDCYCESLDAQERTKIIYTPSTNVFKFGDGNKVHSMNQARIPATIGNLDITIVTDIVSSDIPLLLSKDSMKKAGTKLNFQDDTALILNQKVNLHATSSGHYMIPLTKKQNLLDKIQHNSNTNITLTCTSAMSTKEMAIKLHRQFAHPSSDKLIKLVKSSSQYNEDLCNQIHSVSKNCTICKEYRKPPPRPIVGLPMATYFGECVAMDLKQLGGYYLLHLIDLATRLSACSPIRSKQPDVIIKEIFRIWISIYGCPEKFLSDNGGEFSNDHFRELCERFNITVKTTSAESPWSNGVCERHNQTLAEMITRTMNDTNCNIDLAVAWCINAKNSLQNLHGYSPFQLVFGKNPPLPGLLLDKPPALSEPSSAQIIRDNLNALHAARQAYVSSESSEKIRRALNHNIRSSGDVKYLTGDKVYYKRLNHKRWRGPAVVFGQDGQQVLVKHGGVYVRVHPCRLRLEKEPRIYSDHLNKPTVCQDKSSGTSVELQQPSLPNNENDNSTYDTSSDTDNRTDSGTDNADSDDGNNVMQEAHRDAIRPRGRPPKKTLRILDPNDALKRGMMIRYRKIDDNQWITTKLTTRSGKRSGKFRNEWNAVNPEDNSTHTIDFDKSVAEWEEIVPQISENNNDDPLANCTSVVDTTTGNGTIEEQPVSGNNVSLPSDHDDPPSEILFSEIFQTEALVDIMAAKEKELDSWKRHDVYEAVENRGQKCISVRWVLRPKLIDGKLQTKARLCARGFEEADGDFRTDSPTCMRESVRIVISIIAAKSWILHSIDYKTAFLQGKPIERDIFIRPPKECNTKQIWKLKKTVYGLSDAPRVWYLRLREELIKLGAHVSTYDQGLFYWHSEGMLQGIIISFVDDQLWGGTSKFENNVIQHLRKTFDINYEHTTAFKYIGINLIQNNDKSIVMNQETYINCTNPISIDTTRSAQKNETLTDEELNFLRGLNGQLSWIAGISRPDLSFNSCHLSSSVKSAKVSDLQLANKTLRHAKSNISNIRFPKLDNIQDLQLIVYSDASYANLADGGSQGGQIIFLADSSLNCCPLMWKSTRIKRVVKSTLAAETLAFVEGCDMAFLMAKIIAEIISNKRDTVLPIVCMTDNKSLFEAAQTVKTIKDTRLRVEMSIVREMLEKNEIRIQWIQSNQQLANVLTKNGAPCEPLLKVLRNGHLHA